MRFLLLLALLLAGCAERPPANDPAAIADYEERHDPYEPANRVFFNVNDTVDHYVLRPVAIGYRDGIPAPVRDHVHNVLANLGNPAQLANDMLQGKPRKAGNTLVRLVLNTTAGIGGIFDVAGALGYPDHDTDFGLTLSVWQVPEGPFLFLPLLGPSDPRDAIGYGANSALDPLTWVTFSGSTALGISRFVLGAVDTRARLVQQTDAIDQTALDRYATYRSLYQQHRQSQEIAARRDLPATTPAWFPAPPPPSITGPAVPDSPAPVLAPPPSLVP